MPGHSLSLRQLVLALSLFGMLGMEVELFLLEHTESFSQWIPLVLLAGGLASGVLFALRPGSGSIRIFQVLMTLFVVAGLTGPYLHYAGSVEFALERDPALRGMRLVWKALGGATPALAPGALAQLGLIGLACTYRHPGVAHDSTSPGALAE